MRLDRVCCVRNCGKTREDNIILHRFPNPEKDPHRFRSWTFAIGGNILVLDDMYIYNHRRVCDQHFEPALRTRSKGLSNIAVPTLHLTGVVAERHALMDVTNRESDAAAGEASTSGVVAGRQPTVVTDRECSTAVGEASTSGLTTTSSLNTTSKKKTDYKGQIIPLQKTINRLNIAKDKYSKRLKKALNLSQNKTFQRTLKSFTSLAALFTVLQFREVKKHKTGRRFTNEEKVMALTIYKRGPRAYRLLRKIFVLPSPVTLSRMVSRAGLKPGLNDNLFDQLKKRADRMKPDDKLCTLIFDEMALSPHFDYNRKTDRIVGFVDSGSTTKKIIADHVCVFMIRGILKNYKQPICYTFCSGSTKKDDLVVLLKSLIGKLHSIGFRVLVTVCDQGAANVSAINQLIEDTRRNYLRNNAELRHKIFEINGQAITPLFDVPHLIKGIRNNLLNKNLIYTLDGSEMVAKWDHIIQLHKNNPTYKGIRIIKKLTENHCTPDKIPKMKVKYATQIFSQTVGVNMGYLADQGVLSQECKHTAELILFIDNLFDSMNGSYKNSRNRSGKPLLQALKPNSPHKDVWRQAKPILNSMKFVTSDGKACNVPSIQNWLRTIENMEYLRDKLYNDFNIKSIWCRHLNQDPLENFFGSVRSHGYRNNKPSCAGFEAAFASLLVNNLSSTYSVGSNCEEDSCFLFKSLKKMFFIRSNSTNQFSVELNLNHVINEEIIVDLAVKRRDPRISAALEYVTGYVLRQLKKKVFKNCSICKESLSCSGSTENTYIKLREFNKKKTYLFYPCEELISCFSQIQDIINYILKEDPSIPDIRNYIKLVLYARLDTSFATCEEHKKGIVECLFETSLIFFLCNWCRDTNKVLCGTAKDIDVEDSMQTMALMYANKRRRQ